MRKRLAVNSPARFAMQDEILRVTKNPLPVGTLSGERNSAMNQRLRAR